MGVHEDVLNLGAADRAQRTAAWKRLFNYEPVDLIEPLRGALASNHATLRANAVCAVGRHGLYELADVVSTLVDDSDERVSVAAKELTASPPTRHRQSAEPAGQRPTDKQLDMLRRLATERGSTFVKPGTRREASVEIERLLATPKHGFRSPAASHSWTRERYY